jgi:hypothetical protein
MPMPALGKRGGRAAQASPSAATQWVHGGNGDQLVRLANGVRLVDGGSVQKSADAMPR